MKKFKTKPQTEDRILAFTYIIGQIVIPLHIYLICFLL